MGKAELTKQTIIKQVSELFNKKGYYATSLGDLIKITGLSKGSIYGNFANKEDVAVEAFRYNINILMGLFKTEADKYENTIDKLLAYVTVYRNENEIIMLRGGCPLLNTLVDSDNINDTLNELSISILQRWKKRIETLIHEGIEKGEIHGSTDPGNLADLMISLFEGAGILTRTSGDNCYMNSALNHIETMLLNIKKD